MSENIYVPFFFSILTEDTLSGAASFETLVSALHHHFGPNDYFRVGTAIVSYCRCDTLLPGSLTYY